MRRLWLTLVLAAAAATQSADAQVLFEDQGTGPLPQSCSGSGCWTNSARVVDVDGDDDLDLVAVNCGGFFSAPQAQPLVVWLNDGSGNFADGSSTFGSLVAPLRQVAFGDIDDDGDLDMAAPSAGNTSADRMFVQTTPGVYANEAATRLPVGLVTDAGAVRLGDVDGDGSLDLVVGTGYINDGADPARIFLNDGAGVFVETGSNLPTMKDGVNPDDVDLADIDGDFDLDVLINMHSGQNVLWRNDGAGNFEDVSASMPALTNNRFHYGPVFCDVDGDRDLDLFVDNALAADNFQELLAINDGNGSFTDETAARVFGNSSADDNLISCADVDDDGDFDFVIGSLQTNHRLFENDGFGNFTFQSGAFDGPPVPTLWLELGDLNGDGRSDVFTAQGESSPETERIYFGTSEVAVTTRPPKIIDVEDVTLSPAADNVVRFRVSSAMTTDAGPRLDRAWVQVGTTEVDAKFVGGDVFRAVVPPTSETSWIACARDVYGNVSPDCSGSVGPGSGGAGGSLASGAGGDGPGAGSPGGSGPGVTSAGGGTSGGGGCECNTGAIGRSSIIGLAGLLFVVTRRRRSNKGER